MLLFSSCPDSWGVLLNSCCFSLHQSLQQCVYLILLLPLVMKMWSFLWNFQSNSKSLSRRWDERSKHAYFFPPLIAESLIWEKNNQVTLNHTVIRTYIYGHSYFWMQKECPQHFAEQTADLWQCFFHQYPVHYISHFLMSGFQKNKNIRIISLEIRQFYKLLS